jgi:acyl-CoA synthetase (NDP forming)
MLVNDVVDEAGELGVGAVCIVSAGFAEIGEDGVKLQEDLLDSGPAATGCGSSDRTAWACSTAPRTCG